MRSIINTNTHKTKSTNYTGCPTRYWTRHFFNNSINHVWTQMVATSSTLWCHISHTTNILLFKFRCNIFIGDRIIKEMPGSVASGTPCSKVPVIYYHLDLGGKITVYCDPLDT